MRSRNKSFLEEREAEDGGKEDACEDVEEGEGVDGMTWRKKK